ncbi:MAG TPA: FAD-binding oxidoreductase [Nitratifractor sp.]|nr:FAD-binding oxidoreductase [Nitratifractor sp.]
MKRDIIIVGGGIIGLMTAYHLRELGREVCVIDKSDISSGTSFGNAGLISPFKKNPLSYPGVISDTLKLILKGESPLSIHPTLNPMLYRWLWNFVRSANKNRLERTLALFEKYGERSLNIYQNLNQLDEFNFHLMSNGLLMVYTEEKSFQKKKEHAQDSENFAIYTPEETLDFAPFLNKKIKGSVLLKENASLDPGLLMRQMKEYLLKSGVEFILNEEITKLEFQNNQLSKLISKKSRYEAEQIVLATGANSTLAKQADNNYIMTPAKGYSITFEMEDALKPKVALLFPDLFIAMTPREKSVRLTSKLELGAKAGLNRKQLNSILENLRKYSIEFTINESEEWFGFRPLTPNDIPILGYDKKYKNLIHANGLGWLGITFAPAIGEIVTNLITKEKENAKSDDILLFSSFYQ